jgi:hypothetical protein
VVSLITGQKREQLLFLTVDPISRINHVTLIGSGVGK